jgi:hypothetical protein
VSPIEEIINLAFTNIGRSNETLEPYIMVSPYDGLTNLGFTNLNTSNEILQEVIDLNIRSHGTWRTIGTDIVFGMIFLEAMRQQICHGVGLRCPFWKGECCRNTGFKWILKNLYNITKPWNPSWKHHWQIPPCLQ